MNSDVTSAPSLIRPEWPAPTNIRAFCSTRVGGFSQAPWASLNLGGHVGDAPVDVRANRAKLANACDLPVDAFGWLDQTHGTEVVSLPATAPVPEADASYTLAAGRACTILTADCLPVILCDQQGTTVAAAHAGWRSLCGGVLENLLARMAVPGRDLMAWLGPAIGPNAFEVGPEVRAAFIAKTPQASAAFSASGAREGHYMADIYLLARQRLEKLGITSIHGGRFCTVTDSQRFYSYRRDGQTGRMATVIWKA
ncbi:MAG: peptidoglycan editing factor PgeF [Marinobacter sp.]|uniref:peptidoglycan editing factor PgeF n=1 Tax=Marinobacter sp. TaxID=50741 RepID=UPI003F992E49